MDWIGIDWFVVWINCWFCSVGFCEVCDNNGMNCFLFLKMLVGCVGC